MRIAAFQMIARAGDVAGNLAAIADAARQAKAQGADILVAPELATTGYGAGEAIRDLAEPADGRQVGRLAEIAAELGMAIVAGFPERADGKIYNAAALVTPNRERFVYRKCHLYGEYERGLFAPGDRPSGIVAFRGLKLAVLICYDIEFPEIVRHLALAGADVLLVPTAQSTKWDSTFIAEKIVPVRAFENGIAIVYADHAGADARCTYAGLSAIVMPDGADAARAGPSEAAVIVADYDPSRYVETRASNPYLADRRLDLF